MDISAIIVELVNKYPVLASIIMVIGVLRAINKPLFSLLHAYVDSTPSPDDNEKLDKIEKSSFYTSLVYVLDWFGSIKLK